MNVVVQILSLIWSLFNFWKMANIKSMLVPTLVQDGSKDGPAVLLPPRYRHLALLQEFNSSPWWVAPIERLLTRRPATNDHERLFGAAGADGPNLYRNYIKFHTWLCTAVIVYLGTQVVLRDVKCLMYHDSHESTHPGAVLDELILFGFFVVLCLVQLVLAPKTFLYYSKVTSIEEQT